MGKIHQRKIAMINDISGYGRCSLTVAIPILSAMGVQCCPVPTSILSNHTGFPVWFFDDYTDKMGQYLEKWKELKLSFDGIATGFLGSERQIQMVMEAIEEFRTPNTRVMVDPIMGDHGKAYATYTPKLCQEMEKLVRLADVVTPNVTESCILTGRQYKSFGWSRKELVAMAKEIQAMGPDFVVITGVASQPKEDKHQQDSQGSLTNVMLKPDGEVCFQRSKKAGRERPGTGDVFSSIVSGAAVLGWELQDGVKLAAWFVKRCIEKSDELDVPVTNGVCFELVLPELIRRLK
ncbi:MAG: pyridoxamine kinase [Lachnospiraceae bacterium]|nr:pyridoxamine kinase [Lachnospiraceae bacterium]